MRKILTLSVLAFTSLMADANSDTLQKQIEEQKIATQKLEQQVALLSQKSQQSPNSSASFSQNAYLPDIAFVLNMAAVGRDVKNSEYEDFAIPGFIDARDAELPFNKNRGFNLNYAEVALHSMVDPYFEAFAIFHISPDSLEIEEAFVQTTALPNALKIKAGKFRSAFGRLNEKHHHSWNFDDQAIIYKALFGPDMINDAGVQLQWVAPTDTYIMAGVEAFQGSNDRSFGDVEKNTLYVGYLKSSIDIGDDLSVLGGLSCAYGSNVDANASNPTVVYGADVTLREQLGSYSALIWQSEFLQRDKDVGAQKYKQSGLYSELVYQYSNNYSAGLRYDTILKNEADFSAYNAVDTKNLDKYSAMIEYKPFPMSRLRLSYSYDRTKIIADERRDINSVMLSLNIAAGAHGAHSY